VGMFGGIANTVQVVELVDPQRSLQYDSPHLAKRGQFLPHFSSQYRI
jgi:hypothetical protein